jgi:hypothetical protein
VNTALTLRLRMITTNITPEKLGYISAYTLISVFLCIPWKRIMSKLYKLKGGILPVTAFHVPAINTCFRQVKGLTIRRPMFTLLYLYDAHVLTVSCLSIISVPSSAAKIVLD